MDKPELLDLLVDAIERAHKESALPIFKLVPSPENGLAAFSKAHIFSELSKLGASEKVLKLILPERVKKHSVVDGQHHVELEPGHYDFDVEMGRVFWRIIHGDAFGAPVVTRTPIPDENLKISVELKAGFDNWLTAYRLKKSDDLDSLNPLNLAKVYATAMDIDEKLQMNPSTKVRIDRAFRTYTPLLGLRFSASEYRKDALTYMQNKGVIYSFDFLPPRYGDDIIISLDIPKFQRFKARVIQIYQAKEKVLLPQGNLRQPTTEQMEAGTAKGSDIPVKSPHGKQPITYPLPHDCPIEQLHLEFATDTSVRLSAPGRRPRTVTFSDLGLQDGRRGDMPGVLWETLQTFAEHNGIITWETEGVPHRVQKHLSKHIQRLRRWFRSVFQTDQDPFHPYRPERAYRCRFQIADKSYGGTGRPS